jgi:sugar/nucleoside kinase (ribokinase family)
MPWRHPRILHPTGLTPALSESAAEAVVTAVELARQAGALVSVDVNYRSSLWVPREARRMLSELVRGAHIVITSEDELCLIVTDPQDESAVAEELPASGVSQLVIKRGVPAVRLSDSRDGRTTQPPSLSPCLTRTRTRRELIRQRADHSKRSILVLPRVFGLTRSRSRNSATPSS